MNSRQRIPLRQQVVRKRVKLTIESSSYSLAETYGRLRGTVPQIWGGGRPMHSFPQYFEK